MIYRSKREFQQAISDLSRAAELSPHLARAYFARGLTYKDMRKWGLATGDLRKASDLAKGSELGRLAAEEIQNLAPLTELAKPQNEIRI
jgi:tetratricopeptide (TPR) repeat protein